MATLNPRSRIAAASLCAVEGFAGTADSDVSEANNPARQAVTTQNFLFI
jgi:hypothetical protein